MSLSAADWSEVLDHTRKRVREAGLADLDARVILDFQATGGPERDFVRYLSQLTAGVREQSQLGYRKALNALREAVQLESGHPIEGVEVHFAETDARLYATNRLDLQNAQDLAPLILELERLAMYLRKNGVVIE